MYERMNVCTLSSQTKENLTVKNQDSINGFLTNFNHF